MINYESKLLVFMRPYFGASSGLLLKREMDALHMKGPLFLQPISKREELATRLIDNLFSSLLSSQKIRVVESRVLQILDIGSTSSHYSGIEGVKWGA